MDFCQIKLPLFVLTKQMSSLQEQNLFKKPFPLWNNFNAEVRNAKSIHIFKKMIVTEKKENSIFSVYDPLGVKLLRLQFSHLNEHKFRHGFGDTVSPMCGCNAEITQLDTKEQVDILLYGYPPNKSNALNQGIIKFVINFLIKSGRFDKPLNRFNQ